LSTQSLAALAASVSAIVAIATLMVLIFVARRYTLRQTTAALQSVDISKAGLAKSNPPHFALTVQANEDALQLSCTGSDEYDELKILSVSSSSNAYITPIQLTYSGADSPPGYLGSLRKGQVKDLPFRRVERGAGGDVALTIEYKCQDAILTETASVHIEGQPLPAQVTPRMIQEQVKAALESTAEGVTKLELVSKNPDNSSILDDYRLVLRLATEDDAAEYEESLSMTITIGDSPEDDRVVSRYRTVSTGRRPLRFRSLTLSGIDPDNAITGLKSLRPRYGSSAGDMRLLPLEELPGYVEAIAAFLAPIRETAVDWWVEYTWQNLWEPLRRTGSDYWGLTVKKHYTHIEINVDFPHNTRNPRFLSEPDVGRHSLTTAPDGRPRLTWEITDPTPGDHRIYFGLDEMGST
jgi:hypothetical protein